MFDKTKINFPQLIQNKIHTLIEIIFLICFTNNKLYDNVNKVRYKVFAVQAEDTSATMKLILITLVVLASLVAGNWIKVICNLLNVITVCVISPP